MSRFPLTGTFTALNNPVYRLYWFYYLASSAAPLILVLARGWLVYQMTSSPFLLGVVSGAYSIPVIVLALPGGALADRANKRNLMIISEIIPAFLSLVIAILIAINQIAIWHLILASFLSGAAFSIGQPARMAIIPEIVGRDILVNAIALGSAGFNSMRILAPAIGGFLLVLLGMAPVYFIGTGLTVLGILFLLPMPVKKNPQEQSSTSPRADISSFGNDIWNGLKYIYQNRIVFTLFTIILVPTLLVQPFQIFLPVFASDILKVGEVGLGWMMAAPGIGAVISNLIIASLGDRPRKSYLLLAFMLFSGIILAVFSYSTIFALSLIYLLVLGMCSTGFNTMSNTMLQTYSSSEMRGRAMSVMTIAFGIAPLGAMPIGAVAQATGDMPLSLALSGAFVSLATIGIVIFHRDFRQLR